MRIYIRITSRVALCLLSILSIACSKDNNCKRPDDEQLKATATIINSDVPALDGMRLVNKIGDITYSPDNLPERFKEDDITVKINYTITNAEYTCDWGG